MEQHVWLIFVLLNIYIFYSSASDDTDDEKNINLNSDEDKPESEKANDDKVCLKRKLWYGRFNYSLFLIKPLGYKCVHIMD